MKKKIAVILTYRGNYGKMKSTMQAIKARDDMELQLLVGGATILDKYGQAVRLIEKDGFAVQREIHFLLEGENPLTMAKSTGLAITELATAFYELKPDLIFSIADRFESLAVTVAASYMNIPVAHLEGGEISSSIDESIRHAITKLSHLHFVSTRRAAENVIRMGERPEDVFVVGTPTLDLIKDTTLDFDPFRKYLGVGPKFDLEQGKYLLCIQHPVTTEYERSLNNVHETLSALDELQIPTLWLWPNMDAGADGISKGIRTYREKHAPPHIHFFKNFAFEDYAKLLVNSAALVGNSSSGIRESSFLGVPTVNIGTRQTNRECGHNVLNVPYEKNAIKEAVLKQLAHGKYASDPLYGDGQAGKKIVEILAARLNGGDLSIQKRLSYVDAKEESDILQNS